MVAVSEIFMFIYAVGVLSFIGIFALLMDFLCPTKIVIEKVKKPIRKKYDSDYGGVILDD